jgi:hypothetical protein
MIYLTTTVPIALARMLQYEEDRQQ